ncbi:hypothetical protein NL676_027127 [Syzygium grande]|nr:hypothetical protein NL676_027127 [Syzygium grande]
MVKCCKPSEGSCEGESSDTSLKISPDGSGAASPLESDGENAASIPFQLDERLDSGLDGSSNSSAVRSSDINDSNVYENAPTVQPIDPPESSAGGQQNSCLRYKVQTNWPEQSRELLGLIVNSLRALDGAVPQGCPDPRQQPQSAKKIALILDKAPKHLQRDLVALVPKLVEHSEHPIAAHFLLERIQKPDEELQNVSLFHLPPKFGTLRTFRM